jgi:hypothetical protein
MVAETKESMTKVFDCMSESVRMAFDAGRKTQDAWFKAMGEMKSPGDTGHLNIRGERIFREFAPFISKNMEMAAQCCDAGIRSGADVFKVACDAAAGKPGDIDAYNSTRQVWDATFQAVRTNFDTFGKVGARTMENCTAFCDAILRDDATAKTPAGIKSGK